MERRLCVCFALTGTRMLTTEPSYRRPSINIYWLHREPTVLITVTLMLWYWHLLRSSLKPTYRLLWEAPVPHLLPQAEFCRPWTTPSLHSECISISASKAPASANVHTSLSPPSHLQSKARVGACPLMHLPCLTELSHGKKLIGICWANEWVSNLLGI